MYEELKELLYFFDKQKYYKTAAQVAKLVDVLP